MRTSKPTKKIPSEDATGAVQRPSSYTEDAIRAPAAFLSTHAHRLVGKPKTPARVSVAMLVADGKALAGVVSEHAADLLAVGIEPVFLEELTLRIAIAEAAQTLRAMTFVSQSVAEAEAVKNATHHRATMMRTARYALRRDANAQRVLDRIAEGRGNADLAEDLRALCEVFRANAARIATTGSDVGAMIELAIEVEGKLTKAMGARTLRVKGGTREVQQRNQAVHHAVEAIREVRDAGLFALAGDAKIVTTLRGLSSLSHRSKRGRAAVLGEQAEGPSPE